MLSNPTVQCLSNLKPIQTSEFVPVAVTSVATHTSPPHSPLSLPSGQHPPSPAVTSPQRSRHDTEEPPFCGFLTGKGKKVNISPQKHQRAVSLLGEDFADLSKSLEQVQTPDKHPTIKSQPPLSDGFETARGSRISVRPQQVADAKKLLGDDFFDVSAPPLLCSQATSGGFTTGRLAKISPPPLHVERAKKILGEDFYEPPPSFLPNLDIQDLSATPSKPEAAPPPPPCFLSGRNAPLKISKAHVSRARDVLGEDFFDFSVPATSVSTTEGRGPELEVGGFQTGRGAVVAISSAQKRRAMEVLGDDFEEGGSSLEVPHLISEKNEGGGEADIAARASQGFQSGRGASVLISAAQRRRVEEQLGAEFGGGGGIVQPTPPQKRGAFKRWAS